MRELSEDLFYEMIARARSVCVLGHVSPDGDCVGSCLAVYNYVNNIRGEGNTDIQVYLEEISPKFGYLSGSTAILSDPGEPKTYDLAVICDCAETKRLGRFDKFYRGARESLVIDHHITNEGFGDYGVIKSEASSTCEVLYDLLRKEHIDKRIAECIYTGIVHDTGVFRYSCTSEKTLETAGRCVSFGIDFSSIIEDSFFSMSFSQKKVLGHILGNIRSEAGGLVAVSSLSMEERERFNAESMDMDGMIDHLRKTSGVMMAVFMYAARDGRVKVSLRSNTDLIDVSRIALKYGGGGHRRAAGCFMSPDFEDNIRLILEDFSEQSGIDH